MTKQSLRGSSESVSTSAKPWRRHEKIMNYETIRILLDILKVQGDTKKGTFEKTQQKLKKSKKKNLLTEIEPLQLAF